MPYKKDFYTLLADEGFQDGIINFDSFDREKKRAFVDRYPISKDEFIKARSVINGLSFRGVGFSAGELDYLWKELGIEKPVAQPQPKRQNKKIINWIGKVAAILFAPLLIASIWMFYQTQGLQSFKDYEIDRLSGFCATVSAPAGGRAKAELPDGSEVWLNSGSSVQYPIYGKQRFREVKLTGEGFFKVAKDKSMPMLVTTSGMQVKVYGTTFNINAYEENPEIEAVLVEGNISIKKLGQKGSHASVEYNMKPGEVGKLNKQKNTIAIAKTDNMEVYTGWVKGEYVFKNTQLKNILKRLERLHNVEFVLEDRSIGEYCFDATFVDQNIDRIMEIFSVSLPIKWRSAMVKANNGKAFSTREITISRDKSKKLQ